ncbi:IucA/IucC family C-terminal-domain containing protein, partial [Kitasatospora sp. NPDC057936]|uniref:IucA/IucC family C-terminal-domain containing protein n=1 Tax=Kitasatospora sp. NPDC057936 TaxID=3346283 RepID=UPI0036DE5380
PHPAGPPGQPWRPMDELLDQPGVLGERVTSVRGYLAAAGGQSPDAVEERVAASVTHLGLVARFVSPAFGVAVLDGALLAYGLRETGWQPALGGLFPLSLPCREPEHVTGPAELAVRLAAEVLDGPVRELVQAVAAFSVSPRILWGNVASAVNGAAAAIARSTPELAGQAREFAARLLEQPPLRGAGTLAPDGTGFRRRSCCLIYRAAPDHAGALCGDCVLTVPPGTRPSTTSS